MLPLSDKGVGIVPFVVRQYEPQRWIMSAHEPRGPGISKQEFKTGILAKCFLAEQTITQVTHVVIVASGEVLNYRGGSRILNRLQGLFSGLNYDAATRHQVVKVGHVEAFSAGAPSAYIEAMNAWILAG